MGRTLSSDLFFIFKKVYRTKPPESIARPSDAAQPVGLGVSPWIWMSPAEEAASEPDCITPLVGGVLAHGSRLWDSVLGGSWGGLVLGLVLFLAGV